MRETSRRIEAEPRPRRCRDRPIDEVDSFRERAGFVRIGSENEQPALQSLALVAAGYGLPSRKLGTVSLIGPVRMDYAVAIRTVREAALQLSRFIEDVYEG